MNDSELALEFLLCKEADNNKEFALLFQNQEKSISECCQYIASEVQKLKRGFVEANTILKFAKKYYSEQKIKFKPVNFTSSVSTNDPVFCNQMQDRQEVLKQEELAKKLAERKEKSKTPNQMDIFDIIE